MHTNVVECVLSIMLYNVHYVCMCDITLDTNCQNLCVEVMFERLYL